MPGAPSGAYSELPTIDYPTLPAPVDPVGAVGGAALRHALARVLPAVSKLPEPEHLRGVRVTVDGNRLRLVATDRFRVARADVPWTPARDGATVDALVPATLLDAATRVDTDATVSVLAAQTTFGLATDDHLLQGRVMDPAGYPDTDRFFIDPGEHAVGVVGDELIAAVAQALVAVDDDAGQVQLSVTSEVVEVSAVGQDRHARAEAACDLHGPEITIRFKAAYLRDAIAATDGRVYLHFADTTPTRRPVRVLGGDPLYAHILMPVRGAA